VVGAGAGLGFATAARRPSWSCGRAERSPDRRCCSGHQARSGLRRVDPGQRPQLHYGSRVSLAGLTAQAAATVKGSVFGGSPLPDSSTTELLASVRTAFVAGMDDAVRVAAVVAIAAVLLALAFLPDASGLHR